MLIATEHAECLVILCELIHDRLGRLEGQWGDKVSAETPVLQGPAKACVLLANLRRQRPSFSEKNTIERTYDLYPTLSYLNP